MSPRLAPAALCLFAVSLLLRSGPGFSSELAGPTQPVVFERFDPTNRVQSPESKSSLWVEFSPSGPLVRSSRSEEPLSLRTHAFRRGSEHHEIAHRTLLFDQDRVRYPGTVADEWYVWRDDGLEQGFDLHKRLPGEGVLTIELHVDSHSAHLDADGRHVVLSDKRANRRYYYGGLAVKDALGATVPAHLEVRAAPTAYSESFCVIQLVIDDSNAVYPIVVDPLVWGEQQVLMSSDGGPYSVFGRSVALSGDLLVVGADGDNSDETEGAVYVFGKNAAGNSWVELQKLVPSQQGPSFHFGYDVAISGDRIVVGAPGELGGRGAAYVFEYHEPSLTWHEAVRLAPQALGPGDFFGISVAMDGNSLAVGSSNDNTKCVDCGAVYTYSRIMTSNKWESTQTLTGSELASRDSMGTSVSIAGNLLVAGACANGRTRSSVYVFERDGAEKPWRETQRLVADETSPLTYFGWGLSTDGKRIAVGADSDKGNVYWGAGAAYIFDKDAAGVWQRTHRLVASDESPKASFGFSLSLFEDSVLVGAKGDSQSRGVAYLFSFDAAEQSWKEQKKLLGSSVTDKAQFGESVALGSRWGLVGASGNEGGYGSAYVISARFEPGDPCEQGAECTSSHCVDGVCCDTSCSLPCDRCNLLGKAGTCTFTQAPDPGEPSCAPYACDGVQAMCPNSCDAQEDCVSGYFCNDTACIVKLAPGLPCDTSDSCESGACAGRICCSTACGACGRCDIADALGTCKPLARGQDGEPSCGAFVCDGTTTDCPVTCDAKDDCIAGYVCIDGACQPTLPLGAACSSNDACVTDFCADRVCCAVASCGAYRCDSTGACPQECNSNAECSDGYACGSSRTCDPVKETAEESAGCGCRVRSSSLVWGRGWILVGSLFLWGVRRRRRT